MLTSPASLPLRSTGKCRMRRTLAPWRADSRHQGLDLMALDAIRAHHETADLVVQEFLHARFRDGLPGLRHGASPSPPPQERGGSTLSCRHSEPLPKGEWANKSAQIAAFALHCTRGRF